MRCSCMIALKTACRICVGSILSSDLYWPLDLLGNLIECVVTSYSHVIGRASDRIRVDQG
ncbi:hypothetical protein SISSUDRAFT_1042339 [Sistotremastrum suecicum HHB10207 ss-3]|uniref:Uncharacterized protein n=1 Tax=Sistotremastrum suecicum HHB10207 ss-3 TaxID=1314776 RepID=A0A166GM98_9AGAM|nr:hypothetical protein SISSUDRAFT_1042339 [Sistotremastrum suecicum HHB10207 ss-3]